MRTRTRNVITKTASQSSATVPYGVQYGDGTTFNGTSSIGAYSNKALAGVDETITDELGKGGVNSCVHRKKIWSKGPDELMDYSLPYPSAPWGIHHWGNAKTNWHFNWDAYNGSNLDWPTGASVGNPPRWNITSPIPANEGSLIESALSGARQLKADVLLNVVEANQIWPSIRSLATSLPLLKEHWYSRDFRKMIKTASGSYLAWKFGVSPILSDFMNVHRFLPKLKQDVKRHGDQEKHRVSIIAQPVYSFDTTPWVRNVVNNYNVSEVTYQGLVKQVPIVRYVLVVKPKTKYHTDFFKKADWFMSRFATSPASLAWEKIPFSFVVDWFVDLRGAIRNLDNVLGVEPYEIVSFSRSYSYHLETQVFHEYRRSDTGASMGIQRSGSSECKHYERSEVSTSGLNVPTWRPRFGKNQAGISAALISQKLSTLRTK